MPRYLVIGGGGREHAIAWKLATEPDAVVYVAPGSDGISATPGLTSVDIHVDQHDALLEFAQRERIDLTVVGPEAPLVSGLADHFRTHGLVILGPDAAGAMLEGSKAFAKDVMLAAGVPTAGHRLFEELAEAIAHVETAGHPLVIKADGLAGGKGVVISPSVDASKQTLVEFMADRRFGDASGRVVIEEFLTGPELSFMVVTDGEAIVTLSTSRDHKRLLDGDRGPNTGGMGAISPSPDTTPELEQRIVETVIRPTLRELRARGIDFRGFLYAGLMLTPHGPMVLEFNVRLGDPETQAILFAMTDDLGPTLLAAANGTLTSGTLATDRCACCVVLAAAGYPESPSVGASIAPLPTHPEAIVFHASTIRVGSQWQTSGGRVLGVTARATDAVSARVRAYALAGMIEWPGRQMRTDIGL